MSDDAAGMTASSTVCHTRHTTLLQSYLYFFKNTLAYEVSGAWHSSCQSNRSNRSISHLSKGSNLICDNQKEHKSHGSHAHYALSAENLENL